MRVWVPTSTFINMTKYGVWVVVKMTKYGEYGVERKENEEIRLSMG